ncbi:MAG: hypothetical protein ACOCVG_05285, partial [Verrucomicrobiota bacterium]
PEEDVEEPDTEFAVSFQQDAPVEGLEEEVDEEQLEKSQEEREAESAATEPASTSAETTGVAPRAAVGEEAEMVDTSPRVGFEIFLKELTEYLNSSAYIVEFMADSLRQAELIVNEIKSEQEAPVIQEMRRENSELKTKAEDTTALIGRLDALKKETWDEPFQQFKETVQSGLDEERQQAATELKDKLHKQVDSWFERDDSLKDLVEGSVYMKIRALTEQLRNKAIEAIRQRGRGRNSGLRLSADTVGRFHNLNLNFDDVFPAFEGKLAGHFPESDKLTQINVKQEEIPVKRGFMDYILFRSEGKVRRKLLGEESPSGRRISVAAKQKRLGEPGKAHLKSTIDRYVDETLETGVNKGVADALDAYKEFYKSSASKRFETREKELLGERDGYLKRHREQQKVLDALDELDGASDAVLDSTSDLHRRYVADKLPAVHPASEDEPDYANAPTSLNLGIDDLEEEDEDDSNGITPESRQREEDKDNDFRTL